jgi:hypothetical protein
MNIAESVNQYNLTGKLPTHPYVLCTKTNTKVTMFGSNLANRIKKFGSLEELLKNFICKSFSSEGKPIREPKYKKIKKEKRKPKIERDENKNIIIPKVDLSKKPESIDLVNDPKAKYHLNECWRPDLFLNWDRSCNGCRLYQNCQCKSKRLVDDNGRKVKK